MSPSLRNHFSWFSQRAYLILHDGCIVILQSDRWHYKNWKAISDSLWEYRTEWMFMSVPRTFAVWSLCGVDEVPGAHFHQRLLLAGPIGGCCREFPSAKTQWKIGFKLSEWLLNHKIYGTLLRLVVRFSPVNISHCQFLFESQILCT